MKIGFNVLPIKSGHKTRGMGIYTQNLLDNLRKVNDLQIQEFTNINELNSVDLVHYPFFDPYFLTLPLRKKFPTVVTVGDVTPLLFSTHYPPGIKGTIKNKVQRLSLKGAKAVITFSKSATYDISKVLAVKKEKIFPIYLAASSVYKVVKDKKVLDMVKKKYSLPEKFALFVGSVNWNKNLVNLTEACLKTNTKLVLVGKNFESKDNLKHPELKSYLEFVKKHSQNPNVHSLGFVEEKDLVGIYNLASVLMLPSFYEGFGLPILEAQACGCPVLTSNTSSMPEVAAGGAILVDPYSVDEIAGAIEDVISSVSIRTKLIKAGFENVKRFSWEKTAKETLEVYKYALIP